MYITIVNVHEQQIIENILFVQLKTALSLPLSLNVQQKVALNMLKRVEDAKASINNDYYCCCRTLFLHLSVHERKIHSDQQTIASSI